MMKYAIGGIFVERSLTGVTRYCWEIIAELDKALDNSDVIVEIVMPKGVGLNNDYKNIKIVNFGKDIKFIWYNITFPLYLKKNKSIGIHLGVNVPWLKPDIVCIYDVNSIANPQFFSKYHVAKTKLEKKIAIKNAKIVFSISEFSVDEIVKFLNGNKSGIPVIPCGWQHMNNIDAVGDSKNKFGIDKSSYFFSMSSIATTKNFKWVIEAAKQNPNELFVIAGGTDPKTFGHNTIGEDTTNLKYIGRVSDEEAKILMRDSKAFIFPSYYEGFGIPPLEALACGATKIIISDIPVMREVYGTSAYYIDPLDYKKIDMKTIMNQNVTNAEEILNKYSWKESAEKLLTLMENL